MSTPIPPGPLNPTRLSLAACAAVLLAGLVAGCDSADPVVPPVAPYSFVWEHPISSDYHVTAQPLVEDGRAYVALSDAFVALDADDGGLLWTSPAPQPYGPAALSLLGDADRVYYHTTTWVRAMRKSDGRVLWETPIDGYNALEASRMAQSATHVYLGRRNEVLSFNKASGSLARRFDLRPLVPSGPVGPGGLDHRAVGVSVSPDGGTLYVATYYNRLAAFGSDGYVVAFDATTGLQRWAYPLPQVVGPNGMPSDAAATGVAVAGDVVVVTSGDSVYALDGPSGTVRWVRTFEDHRFLSGPAVGDGAVFVGSYGDPTVTERVLALDLATGAERWRQSVGGYVFSDEVLAVRDGRLHLRAAGEVWVLATEDGGVRWHGGPAGRLATPVGVGEGLMVVAGAGGVHGLSTP